MSQMVLGVLGGGQLGRMLALAAARLGVRTRLFDPDPEVCGGQVAELVAGAYEDTRALARFCDGLTAATIEFENVPIAAMEYVSGSVRTHPSTRVVGAAQDRVAERELLLSAGFAVPQSRAIESLDDLRRGCEDVGLPSVLKTRRMGYDGKGQHWIRDARDIERAWNAMAGVPVMIDRGVSFAREISLLAVRGRDGQVLHYPPTENVHQGGILVTSCAPAAGVDPKEIACAQAAVGALLERLEYVGVLAVEFFDLDGKLLANEMAPRVHNSGHWTMNCSGTCQFENHVRAVLGLPLGETGAGPSVQSAACMVNLIGAVPPMTELLRAQGWHVHLYGKSPRAGRKLGHANWCGPRDELARTRETMLELVSQLHASRDSTNHNHV